VPYRGTQEVKVNGKTEYFSEISKPPRSEVEVEAEEELLF
jgi:penicillin-binding protein 1A